GQSRHLSMGQPMCPILNLKRCLDCQIMTEQMNRQHLSRGISVEASGGCCLRQGQGKSKCKLCQQRVTETRKSWQVPMDQIILCQLRGGSCEQIRIQVHLQRLNRFGGKFAPVEFIGGGTTRGQE